MGRYFSRHLWQDAEKVRQRRSRLVQTLNVPSMGRESVSAVSGWAGQNVTPRLFTWLRPCWMNILSILAGMFSIVLHVWAIEFLCANRVFRSLLGE